MGEALNDDFEHVGDPTSVPSATLGACQLVSKENASIVENTLTQAPISCETRPYMSTSDPYGKQSLDMALKGTFPAHLASPVTTYYEVLAPDKRRILPQSLTTTNSKASEKSVRILKKFWGEADEDESASDSSMANTIDTRVRNNKQKKKTKRQTSPKNTSSGQTRSNKGVIKTNPKYQ